MKISFSVSISVEGVLGWRVVSKEGGSIVYAGKILDDTSGIFYRVLCCTGFSNINFARYNVCVASELTLVFFERLFAHSEKDALATEFEVSWCSNSVTFEWTLLIFKATWSIFELRVVKYDFNWFKLKLRCLDWQFLFKILGVLVDVEGLFNVLVNFCLSLVLTQQSEDWLGCECASRLENRLSSFCRFNKHIKFSLLSAEVNEIMV